MAPIVFGTAEIRTSFTAQYLLLLHHECPQHHQRRA